MHNPRFGYSASDLTFAKASLLAKSVAIDPACVPIDEWAANQS